MRRLSFALGFFLTGAGVALQKEYDMTAQLKIKQVPTNSLKPHPKNPRIHPDSAINKLVSSIKEFGWTNPVLVSADGYIMAGHARVKAAIKAGLETVPAIFLPLSGKQAELYMLADNRLQDETDWDMPVLAELLKDFGDSGLDATLTGFDSGELEKIISQFTPPKEGLIDDDEIPEKVETICKAGDLWQLGSHRLLVGDATKESDIRVLMNSEKADMVFTDPPYGVNYDGGTKKQPKLAGDNDASLYAPSLQNMFVFSSDKVALYLWFASTRGKPVFDALLDNHWIIRAMIVWNKNQAQYGALAAQYHQKHEAMLYCHKKTKAPSWYGGTCEITVWNCNRQSINEYHPTQKPVELAERAINNSSRFNDIVVDLFGGSGSTLIACEKLGRRCYMMEIDNFYCDVIRTRWEAFTGKKAVKID